MLLLALPVFSFAQQEVAWDYPAKPGSEEWKVLNTETERIDAMQIPEKVLNNMKTEEFAKAIVNFPLFGYYTAFNTPQNGFNVMFSRFNIFQKLCENDELGTQLIKIYKDAEMYGWKTKSNELKEDYWTLKFSYIEYLLAQNEILTSLDELEKKELIIEVREKLNKKIKHESFNSLSGIGASTLIIGRILENEVKKELLDSSEFQYFIKSGHLRNGKLAENILNVSQKYLNNK